MPVKTRHLYQLHLSDAPPAATLLQPEGILLSPTEADIPALAELMIDAYRDTIDYDGETVEQAVAEIESYFAGETAEPLPYCSRLYFSGKQLAAACLVSWWPAPNTPLVAYVMTTSAYKGQGLGKLVVREALQALARDGYETVSAVITEGNIPSEELFAGLGFVQIK